MRLFFVVKMIRYGKLLFVSYFWVLVPELS